jgi:HlyD family secretion protein
LQQYGWFVPHLLRRLKKSNITTAVVEKGDIENTISASGEILPEFEEIVTSPINASIQNVVMDAGNKVQAGQSILTLDKSASQTEYEKERFELESKRNDIQKLKLELNKSFYDIKVKQ